MTDWATRDAVQNASEDWTDEQITCRIYSHAWRNHTVTHHTGSDTFTIAQRCTRCRNQRYQSIDSRGYPLGPWNTNYQHGYLMPPGAGRVGVDGRAALRLASLRNVTIREVTDEP